QQAVDKDYQTGLFQVLQLGMFDLTVDLGQSFFAAHRQHRVPEPYESDDEHQVAEESAVQPTHRLAVDGHDAGMQGIRRKLHRDLEYSDGAPDEQDHDHDGRDNHDLKGLPAGFVNALNVLVPEVENDDDR